ncbi:MAG: hypothetical protein EOP02_06205 [Proteobacteria bacterium]|nr:MAG: hypothetical protein EOP02_06205 [Pseudomonadota bacterium]
MIYEREYLESQFTANIDKLNKSGADIKSVRVDQARFNGLRHHQNGAVSEAPNSMPRSMWQVNGVPLFIVPTDGSRLLEVELHDGTMLRAEYEDADVRFDD